MVNSIYLINSRGEKELFSYKKVYQSARRVGASQVLAKKIANAIQKEVYPGIRTSEIFKKIKKLLKKEAPRSALKFSLKEGMRKLGPTGFPFEKYIGEIFSKKGFNVRLNQYISGFCGDSYEIDFLAQKDSLLYIGECKYHHLAGGRVHLDVALSNYARFLDIKRGGYFKNFHLKSLLVTNTKFTSEVIRYSQCVGVELLGWRYPRREGLEQLIESEKLYPITILPSLNRYLANVFIGKKLALVQDLLRFDIKKLVRITKIQQSRLISLIKEAKILLGENENR